VSKSGIARRIHSMQTMVILTTIANTMAMVQNTSPTTDMCLRQYMTRYSTIDTMVEIGPQ